MALQDLTVGELLEAVAARTTAPGGGAAAALATGLAAALAAMAARFSEGQDAAASRADDLRARVVPLADADADAYGAFMAALRLPKDDPGRRAAVAAAREAASAVPAEVTEIAGQVAALGAELAEHGNPNLRGDALAAVELAAAAAATAAELVAANTAKGEDPPRLRTARATAAAAAAARPA
ncbi:cyclodeaminase/cyclohydrolase family protein [Actinomycetes bacterium KLBMP 9759]